MQFFILLLSFSKQNAPLDATTKTMVLQVSQFHDILLTPHFGP